MKWTMRTPRKHVSGVMNRERESWREPSAGQVLEDEQEFVKEGRVMESLGTAHAKAWRQWSSWLTLNSVAVGFLYDWPFLP